MSPFWLSMAFLCFVYDCNGLATVAIVFGLLDD